MSAKKELVGRASGSAIALLGLLVASPVRAQGIGGFTGTVVDASTKAPVSDVVVTATSAQLQGEQASITDETGTYHISQLPPGGYTLRFEKETYKPYSRGTIALDADQILRLNVELLPESLKSEEILVLGKPPLIDVGSTQSGLTVTGVFSESVPISPSSASNGGIRSYQGLALAAPQVSTDAFGISIAGTTSPENSYLIDGLNFGDTGFGVHNRGASTAGSDFPLEFIDQMNVITGGYMPQYGRTTGGVLSLTTKSGGNEFHGSVFATWTPAFLAQTAEAVGIANSVINGNYKLYNTWDVGFTLGGYIIKDKLWFFVGFDPSQYKVQATRLVIPFDASGNPGTQIYSSQNYYQTQTDYPYIAKLTYLINSDNRLSLVIAGMPDSLKVPYANPNGTYNSSGYAGNDNTIDAVLGLSSSFLEKKILLDIMIGWHHQKNNLYDIDGSSYGSGAAAVPLVVFQSTNLANFPEDPALQNPQLAALCSSPTGDMQCSVAGYSEGGGNVLRNVTEDRIQGKAILTYFWNALGHQTWKAGIDIEYATYENKQGLPGEAIYQAYGSPVGPGAYFGGSYGYLSGPDAPVVKEFQDQTTSYISPGFSSKTAGTSSTR